MPAGDATFSQEAMSETFFLSNMSPQSVGLNRGQWSSLEKSVRKWAYHFDSLYVVTGPIFTEFIDTIGKENSIPVPKFYYKALLILSPVDTQSIAFILPNEKVKSYKKYHTSIDSLESISEINFFPCLPEKFEENYNSEFWFSFLSEITLPSHSKNQSLKSKTVQCEGTTKKGERCKIQINTSSKFCHSHQ